MLKKENKQQTRGIPLGATTPWVLAFKGGSVSQSYQARKEKVQHQNWLAMLLLFSAKLKAIMLNIAKKLPFMHKNQIWCVNKQVAQKLSRAVQGGVKW